MLRAQKTSFGRSARRTLLRSELLEDRRMVSVLGWPSTDADLLPEISWSEERSRQPSSSLESDEFSGSSLRGRTASSPAVVDQALLQLATDEPEQPAPDASATDDSDTTSAMTTPLMMESMPSGNTAPTTSGFSAINLDGFTEYDYACLYDVFGDGEDYDDELSYQIVSNTNPSLVTQAVIDSGYLNLSFDRNAYGTAAITVRATDTGGLWVESTLSVQADNTAPTTSGFSAINLDGFTEYDYVCLYDVFGDGEDYDDELSYQIVSNTNPSLVTQATIDSGYLNLSFDRNAYSTAAITVRATDTGGLWVESTLSVQANNTAPTTSGFSALNLEAGTQYGYVCVHEAFSDGQDYDDELVYCLSSNSNPSLVVDASIDSSGYLNLQIASDGFGDAALTVRAMDTGGLWVESVLNVHVEQPNCVPVISGFVGSEGPLDFWTFSGTVTDADDPVGGMTVVLGGVLGSFDYTATVQSDGSFSLTKTFPGLFDGTATAQTTDPRGLASGVASYYVTVS